MTRPRRPSSTAGRRTNTHTYFFREPAAIHMVRDRIIAPKAKQGETTHIWCAGCSTGEEPYSIAIAAAEGGGRIELLASDINPDAIASAQRARYHRMRLRHVDDERRERFFIEEGNEFTVKDEVRSVVRFQHQDISCDPPLHAQRPREADGGSWDVIFFRHVMIYLTGERLLHAITSLASALVEGGILILATPEWISTKVQSQLPTGIRLRLTEMDDVWVYRRGGVEDAVPVEPAAQTSWLASALSAPLAALKRATGALIAPVTPIEAPGATPSVPPTPVEPIRAPKPREPSGPKRATPGDQLGALRERGDHLLDAAQPRQALQAYQAAIAINALLPDLHLRAGLCYLQLEDELAARESCRRALFLSPELWPAALILGDLCKDQDPTAAVRYFSQAEDALARPAAESAVAEEDFERLAFFLQGRSAALEAVRRRIQSLKEHLRAG